MSEKPPRRKKKESLEPDHNPELERLIARVAKGDVPETKKEIQLDASSKRIISRENDAQLQSQLRKFDSLHFKPGFPAEEIFSETPSTKEAVSDNQLDTVLAKIAAEKNLTGAMFLNYLNDIGGKSASPEAVEKIMTLASERLDRDVFNKLQTIVSPSSVNEPEIPKEEVIPESYQAGNEKVPDEVKSVEAPQVPGNLPHGSEEELKKFEEGLTKSVEEWRGKRKKLESNEPSQEAMPEVTSAPVIESSPETTPAPEVKVEEAPKGALFSDAQRRRFAELAGEEYVAEEDTGDTHKEKRSYLGGLIKKAEGKLYAAKKVEGISPEESVESKEGEKTTEQGERLKTHLAERSMSLLHEASEKYGPKVFEVIEGYNKLGWKKKLAITGCLMVGAGLSATAMPAVSTAFGAALWGQRMVGGLGTVINRRKEIDAKVAKNPESWLANRSEFTKNTYAFALGMVWSLGTSLAVHGGVEAVKVVAESDVFNEGVEKAKELSIDAFGKAKELSSATLKAYDAMNWDWLSKMLNHAPNQEVVEGVVSNTAPDSIPAPEAEAAALAYVAPEHPEDILHGPAPEVVLPPHYSGQYIQETYDKFAWFNRTPEQLRALAADSLIKDLRPEHQALIDNHISSLSPAERVSFLQYLEESKNNPSALSPTGAYPTAQVDAGIENLKGHLDTMQELSKESSSVTNSVPDTSAGESHVEQVPVQGPSPAYQEDLMRSHVKGLNDEWSKLYDERAQVHAGMATAQAEGSTAAVQELSAKEAHIDQRMSDIKKYVEETGAGTSYGRDPLDGHPMTKQEADALTELRNAMHDPRPVVDKSLFDKVSDWFGGDKNAAETVATPDHIVNEAGLTISTGQPAIYADSGGHLFAYGGSIESKIEVVQKFLTENPDKVIYGTDDNGNYRIPWSLYEGHALPGEPVRTSGFLGFFSSFMDAPKPEEFVKIIK
ncbi:MAG: hypothetical protein Q7T37_00035 [bacterium]|nr:hypothetical protein [bacterium]MDO8742708.1 hypothetical protein [bacterium]